MYWGGGHCGKCVNVKLNLAICCSHAVLNTVTPNFSMKLLKAANTHTIKIHYFSFVASNHILQLYHLKKSYLHVLFQSILECLKFPFQKLVLGLCTAVS